MKDLDNLSPCDCQTDGAGLMMDRCADRDSVRAAHPAENAFLRQPCDPHEDRFSRNAYDPHEDGVLVRGRPFPSGRLGNPPGFHPPPSPPPGPQPPPGGPPSNPLNWPPPPHFDDPCILQENALNQSKSKKDKIATDISNGDLGKIFALQDANDEIVAAQKSLDLCVASHHGGGILFAVSQDVVLSIGEFIEFAEGSRQVNIRFGAIFMTFYPPFRTHFSYILTGGALENNFGELSNVFQFSGASGVGTFDPQTGQMDLNIKFKTSSAFGENTLSFSLSADDDSLLPILGIPNGMRAQQSVGGSAISADFVVSGPGVSSGSDPDDFFGSEQISPIVAFLNDIPYPIGGALQVNKLTPSPLIGS